MAPEPLWLWMIVQEEKEAISS